MKNWLFAIATLTTFISSGQTPANNVRKNTNRFYISDETGKKTIASASLNGKFVGTVNKEGWIEISGLKLSDKIRIYKSDYDTLFYYIQSELDYGNTLYGQLNPTKYGFINIAPWDKKRVADQDDPKIIETVPAASADEPPAFPGGSAALAKYLEENLVYPESAKAKEIEGKVYIRFIVMEDGTISNPVVQRKLIDCPECDEEVLRIVGNMPKWIPAKTNGKAVKCYWNLPVSFRLP